MAHQQISCRVTQDNNTVYYIKENGQTLNAINAITIEGFEDTVFTVTQDDKGQVIVRMPSSSGITKFKLYDIINKLNKNIYLVA